MNLNIYPLNCTDLSLRSKIALFEGGGWSASEGKTVKVDVGFISENLSAGSI